MRLVFDTEADELLKKATVMHCLCCQDIDTGARHQFYGDITVPGHHGSLALGVDYVLKADELVGHNIIEYDLPLITKLFGKVYTGKVIDTLTLSRALYPDRPMPEGCPHSVLNPVTGRMDRIGPHSIAAWGYRVGEKKVENHDWRVFTEHMLQRCIVDVDINFRVYLALCHEIKENLVCTR
jgi:hypothetical protein